MGMSRAQRATIMALKGKEFKAGSFDEQFVSDMIYRAENEPGYILSDKQNLYLFKLAQRLKASKDIQQHIRREKAYSEDLQGDRAKLIVAEGKLRILREVMSEYAAGLQDDGERARKALELTQEA